MSTEQPTQSSKKLPVAVFAIGGIAVAIAGTLFSSGFIKLSGTGVPRHTHVAGSEAGSLEYEPATNRQKQQLDTALALRGNEHTRQLEAFGDSPTLALTSSEHCAELGRREDLDPHKADSGLVPARLAQKVSKGATKTTNVAMNSGKRDEYLATIKTARKDLRAKSPQIVWQAFDSLVEVDANTTDPHIKWRLRQVFEEQRYVTPQLWLLEKAQSYRNQGDGKLAALEAYWIWHGRFALHQRTASTKDLDFALSALARIKSPDDAVELGLGIAGYLCQYKCDEDALRALNLVNDKLQADDEGKFDEDTRSYMAAIAYLIGQEAIAEQWHEQASNSTLLLDGSRIRPNSQYKRFADSLVYSLSVRFVKEKSSTEKENYLRASAVLAISTAVADHEDDTPYTRRRPTRSDDRRWGDYLVTKSGNFDRAGRIAVNEVPAHNSTITYDSLARAYTLDEKAIEASDAYANCSHRYHPAVMEAAFHLYELRSRQGEALLDLYLDAISESVPSNTVAAISGIVAGRSRELPTRFDKFVSYY